MSTSTSSSSSDEVSEALRLIEQHLLEESSSVYLHSHPHDIFDRPGSHRSIEHEVINDKINVLGPLKSKDDNPMRPRTGGLKISVPDNNIEWIRFAEMDKAVKQSGSYDSGIRRHYRGVRMRPREKFAAEIRDPNKKGTRVWLRTYDMAVEAARAYGRAMFKLRRSKAIPNLPLAGTNEGATKRRRVEANRNVEKDLGTSTTPGWSASWSECDVKAGIFNVPLLSPLSPHPKLGFTQLMVV